MRYIKIILLSLLLPLVALAKPIKTEELHIEIEKRSPYEQLSYYTDKYGSDYNLLSLIIKNESEWNHNNCGDNGLSCGLAQYQKSTFIRHSKLLGEELDYTSSHDQLKLIAYIFSLENESLKKEWTAYRCIKNGGKYSFYSKQLKKHFNVSCEI